MVGELEALTTDDQGLRKEAQRATQAEYVSALIKENAREGV